MRQLGEKVRGGVLGAICSGLADPETPSPIPIFPLGLPSVGCVIRSGRSFLPSSTVSVVSLGRLLFEHHRSLRNTRAESLDFTSLMLRGTAIDAVGHSNVERA
jgi:hypothetical protein